MFAGETASRGPLLPRWRPPLRGAADDLEEDVFQRDLGVAHAGDAHAAADELGAQRLRVRTALVDTDVERGAKRLDARDTEIRRRPLDLGDPGALHLVHPPRDEGALQAFGRVEGGER